MIATEIQLNTHFFAIRDMLCLAQYQLNTARFLCISFQSPHHPHLFSPVCRTIHIRVAPLPSVFADLAFLAVCTQGSDPTECHRPDVRFKTFHSFKEWAPAYHAQKNDTHLSVPSSHQSLSWQRASHTLSCHPVHEWAIAND